MPFTTPGGFASIDPYHDDAKGEPFIKACAEAMKQYFARAKWTGSESFVVSPGTAKDHLSDSYYTEGRENPFLFGFPIHIDNKMPRNSVWFGKEG